jgi:hypothetical protein
VVEFYDPERRDDRPAAASAPPAGARIEGPPRRATSSGPPVVELILIGVAVLLILVVNRGLGLTRGGGLILVFLFEFLYPLTAALLTAAIVSLLLRRVPRRHRAEISAELGRLHTELAAVRAAGSGDGER